LTRPTSDRVREALFSSLEAVADLRGATVLDLYAGSGALGLEAASRGAARVTLVDSGTQAVKVMAENVRAVGLPGVAVVKARVADFLQRPPVPSDLVLLDPPYAAPDSEVEEVLSALTVGWLWPGAIVVVERGREGAGVSWPAGFAELWQRRFGDTHLVRAVWYGHGTGR
jgi:16S rRNA (guanine966-N2)-methyltransferase